jgi:hypothetical protein
MPVRSGFTKWTLVRYTLFRQPCVSLLLLMTHMTNNLIDTRTHALWESVIIQGTGIRIPLHTCLMTDRVQLVCRNTRFNVGSCQIKDFPCELTSVISPLLDLK